MYIRVCVARGAQVVESWVELPAGASVAQAIQASGLAPQAWPGAVGVHGEVAGPGRVLQAGDRVELYQPLAVDPRTRRRERARRRG